jgi:hypothetical protein
LKKGVEFGVFVESAADRKPPLRDVIYEICGW